MEYCSHGVLVAWPFASLSLVIATSQFFFWIASRAALRGVRNRLAELGLSHGSASEAIQRRRADSDYLGGEQPNDKIPYASPLYTSKLSMPRARCYSGSRRSRALLRVDCPKIRHLGKL